NTPCRVRVQEALTLARSRHAASRLGDFMDYLLWACEEIRARGYALRVRIDPPCRSATQHIRGGGGVVEWQVCCGHDDALVWDLVHELGHVVLGPPAPGSEQT